MISSRAFRFIFITACLGAANLISAQSPSPLTNNNPLQLVTFCMIGGKEVAGQGDVADKAATFKFRTDRVVHDLHLNPGQTTAVFQRTAETQIQIYREQPDTDPAKPPLKIPVAETTVEATWRNIMVLVALDEASGQIALKPINQNLDSVPKGEISFINLLNVPLALKLGGSNGLLPAKGHLNLALGLKGDEVQMIHLLVAAEIEGEGQLISSMSLPLDPKDRRLAIIYPSRLRPVQVMVLNPAPPDPVDLPTAQVAKH